MPNYIFKHPSKEEHVEVFFHMNDKKIYKDKDGVEWNRVFTSSQLQTTSQFNEWDSKSFAEKTGKMKCSYGDLLDASAEMSSARAEKNGGIDPIKEKAYKKYSKERGGVLHPQQKKEQFNRKMKDKGISIE